jgi:putative hydrolase of the HAD superfamily
MKKILLFDWGNTVMVDFVFPGPMCSWDRVDWVEGTEQAMEILSKKYPCYLATNAGASTTEEVHLALDRVDAGRHFKGIFLAEEVGFKKPDVRYFENIISALGVSAGSFIMIGDNYFNDCVGAKKAGMKTVLFNASRVRGSFPLADAVIYSMEDLPEIIETL